MRLFLYVNGNLIVRNYSLFLTVIIVQLLFLPLIYPIAGQIKYTRGDEKRVKLTVYYESLCPASRSFILSLNSVVNTAKVNLRFVPFGKAHIEVDGSNYRCQHGQLECFNNIIQACTLETLNSSKERLSYLACAMYTSTLEAQQNCVQDRGKSWKRITYCAYGKRGVSLTLIHSYDTLTNANGPQYVPTVVFNKKYKWKDQNVIHSEQLLKYTIDDYNNRILSSARRKRKFKRIPWKNAKR